MSCDKLKLTNTLDLHPQKVESGKRKRNQVQRHPLHLSFFTMDDPMSLLLGVPLWYWLPFTVAAFVLTVVAYLVYSGLVASIEVKAEEPTRGDITVAYKTGTGPYKNVGELFTEVRYLSL